MEVFLQGIIEFFVGIVVFFLRFIRSTKSFGERLVDFLFSHPRIIFAGIISGIGVTAVIAVLLFTGPHMTYQNKLLAFQSLPPGAPEGSVPVEKDQFWIDSTGYGPVALTPQSLQAGKRAYELYCLFCHGEKGDGSGPVGQSYVPAPADLRSYRVQVKSDSALYEAMFHMVAMMVTTETDTVPIFRRLIPPQYRWHIVAYVKYLGNQKGSRY